MRKAIQIAIFLTCVVTTLAQAATQDTDWSLYGNGYENQRHSTLEQINRDTVSNLTLAWNYHTGKVGSFQANPVVVDGTMFLSTAFNDVVALNAASGQEIWRYQHQLKKTKTCCGPANRGVAVAKGRVFEATIDGRLVALDQKSGMVLWDVEVQDIETNIQETLTESRAVSVDKTFQDAKRVGGTGHSFNMAPQVFNDLVFIGSTGTGYGLHLDTEKGLTIIGRGDGRTGLRGFLAAFDVETGKEVWRWYSVPDSSWVGDWQETTTDGTPLNRDIGWEKAQLKKFPNAWKLGGGSIWTTPAIDESTGMIFFGTGNPAPNMEDSTRPGDNLHTASVVALDSNTGQLIWAFQQVPHDRWGYDAASPIVLFDVELEGKKIPAVGQAGKTGWFYVLNRKTGELLFKSEPFVPQSNLFAEPTEQGVTIYPGIEGGSNWSPVAIDPAENTVFIAGMHVPITYYKKAITEQSSGPWESYTYLEIEHDQKFGLLSAIDLNTGKKKWAHKTANPLIGGVLHTSGGLVFSGEGSGEFYALDAQTGQKMWSYITQFGVNAPPITYQINGTQYIAVAAGGNKIQKYAVGDELLVFSLSNQKGE